MSGTARGGVGDENARLDIHPVNVVVAFKAIAGETLRCEFSCCNDTAVSTVGITIVGAFRTWWQGGSEGGGVSGGVSGGVGRGVGGAVGGSGGGELAGTRGRECGRHRG